jgi:ketosteroid isomerase-like protein
MKETRSNPVSITMASGQDTVIERNRTLVRRLVVEVMNGAHYEILPELIAPDAELDHPLVGKAVDSITGVKQVIEAFRKAFPDWNNTIDDLVVDGHAAAMRVTCEGTQQAALYGIEPTNRHITWTGMNFMTIENGKITSLRVCDTVLHQLRAT